MGATRGEAGGVGLGEGNGDALGPSSGGGVRGCALGSGLSGAVGEALCDKSSGEVLAGAFAKLLGGLLCWESGAVLPEWAVGMSRSRPVDTAVGEVGETPTEFGEKVIKSKCFSRSGPPGSGPPGSGPSHFTDFSAFGAVAPGSGATFYSVLRSYACPRANRPQVVDETLKGKTLVEI